MKPAWFLYSMFSLYPRDTVQCVLFAGGDALAFHSRQRGTPSFTSFSSSPSSLQHFLNYESSKAEERGDLLVSM